MASYNKVMLMGNLVRDPELRVTPSGLSICRFTLACSRSVKSEKAEYIAKNHSTGDIGYAGDEENFIPYSY